MAKVAQDNKTSDSGDAFERLIDLQRLGQVLFEREAGRLAQKHGIDNPRVQRMMRTAGGARIMLSALEISRDATPQEVDAAKDETVVYGRVAYDNLKAAPDIEVTIEDAEGNVIISAGSAATGADGRFILRISPEASAKLAGGSFFVTARTIKGELVYRAARAVKLELGGAVSVDANIGVRSPIRRTPGKTTRPGGKTQSGESDAFSVCGQVVDADGKPVAGVLVRVYDKDVKYDDLLGAALTNAKGEFKVIYHSRDFSEGEERADLYFVVLDADEKELLSTADRVMFDADRDASVTLKLPKAG